MARESYPDGMPARKRDKDGIFDRGDGWLYLQHKGERVSLKTQDRKEAKAIAARHKAEAADPAVKAARLKPLGEAFSEFEEYAETGENRTKPPSPETFEMYAGHFAHFTRIWGADMAVGEIDSDAVDAYIAKRRGEHIGKKKPGPDLRRKVQATTVDKELGTLRQVLRLGLRRGWYHLPLERVLPKSAGGEYVPLKRGLTAEQVPRLLAALNEHRAAYCAFVIAFAADVVCMDRATLDDMGGPDWARLAVLIRGSKNAKRFDEVPIIGHVFGTLANLARDYLARHGRFQPWGKQRCRDLAVACRRAGVPRVTPRDLRRTHAMILAELGVDPHLIGKMMRHADARMAERSYAHVKRETVGRQVAEAIT